MKGIDGQIEEIITLLKSGMDHSEIKKMLLEQGCDEEIASALIKQADSFYLDDLMIGKPEAKPLLSRSMVGVLMIFVGVSVTILTYLGAIGYGGVYVFWYGPVLAGIGMLTARSGSRLKDIRNTFRSPYDRWKK